MTTLDATTAATRSSDRPAIPGPRSALWMMLRYLRDPDEAVLSLGRRYGDPFQVPSFTGSLVVTWCADGVRAIFGAEPDTFEPFAAAAAESLLGRGSVLIQHGAPHRRARKLMQPPFHGARMRAYGDQMRESAQEHLAATPRGRPFSIEATFREISLDVIIRTVFGVKPGERLARTRRGVLDTLASFGPLLGLFTALRREFGGFGPWARFRRLLGGVHDLLREEIRARREAESAGAEPGTDVLSLLVAARDEDGTPMEEQEIVEQLFTMVIAGHETTATALAWAVEEVHRAPGLVDRAREELLPTGGDPEKLVASPLLDAICSETLRLRPLIPMVSRRLLRPLEVQGHLLPAGTGLAASLLLAHRDPSIYPEPDTFRPERFMGGAKLAAHQYFPFGGGARRCLGAALAFHEMKVVLGTLLLTTDLELASPSPSRNQVRQATVGPRGGVKVIRR